MSVGKDDDPRCDPRPVQNRALARADIQSQEKFYDSPGNFLVVARSLFRADELRQLRRSIDVANARSSAQDERSRVARSVGVATDEVRLNRGWYEIWAAARTELFTEVVPGFTQIIFPPQIRTVRNCESFVPWHQDSAYMRALGDRGHRHVITCFVPLEESTRGRPSIEFALRTGQGPVDHLVLDGASINQFDLPDASKPAPEVVQRYDLNLGDAFVFGHHVLHRSYADGGQFESRTSMEFRLTTRTSVINGKDYFDIERGSWYVA